LDLSFYKNLRKKKGFWEIIEKGTVLDCWFTIGTPSIHKRLSSLKVHQQK